MKPSRKPHKVHKIDKATQAALDEVMIEMLAERRGVDPAVIIAEGYVGHYFTISLCEKNRSGVYKLRPAEPE